MNVARIISEYLKTNGYDGLYNLDGGCACEIGDLAPCECLNLDCKAGIKEPCDCEEGHRFHIVPKGKER